MPTLTFQYVMGLERQAASCSLFYVIHIYIPNLHCYITKIAGLTKLLKVSTQFRELSLTRIDISKKNCV